MNSMFSVRGKVMAGSMLATLVACEGGNTLEVETTSAALTATADCSSWSLTQGAWGGDVYVVADVMLEQADGSVACTDGGALLLSAEGADRYSFAGTWDCALAGGDYTMTGEVTIYAGTTVRLTPEEQASWPANLTFELGREVSGTFACAPTGGGVDPRTPGYWKNHPEAWGATTLTIGGGRYDQACLLTQLSQPTRGDIRIKLIHHLIAAKLNTIAGAEDAARIADTITAADRWLSASGTTIECPGGSLTGDAPRGGDKDEANRLKTTLDVYNNS